jgi:predicted alpha/beta hydrolase family esterase
MATSVLIVPGFGDSGPDHWQSLWEETHPDYRRVMQRDWFQPERDEWVAALDAAVAQAEHPVVLVAHSLGCLAVAYWAEQHQRPIQGALLVAPPDADDPDFAADDGGFAPVPLSPLPFASIVVASADDPYCSLERASSFARAWGSLCVSVGASGHINTAAGFGPWPFGEELLAALCSPEHLKEKL